MLAVHRTTRRRYSGLTLPETLVALVGLAIVVLGIVAVHVERLQTIPIVAWRSDAKMLAEEFAAIVRDETLKSSNAQQAPVRFENPIGVTCRVDVKSLSAVDVAANQVACWQGKVASQLPNGSGTIAIDQAAVPQVYVITVSWSQGGGSTASLVLRTKISPQLPVAMVPLAQSH
jgi:Tfp pilus assembly protein PilV